MRPRPVTLVALVLALLWFAPVTAVAVPDLVSAAGPAVSPTAPAAASSPAPILASSDTDAAENVRGRLLDPDREPLTGLTITVTDSSGAEVGTATTDDEGNWSVGLPGPGTYTVSLDPADLPAGVVPRTEGGESREVVVRAQATQSVILATAESGDQVEETAAPTAGEPDEAEAPPPQARSGGNRYVQLVVEGIRFGSLIAITAVGLSLVFGTTRLINFAHGEFVTIGAATAYFLSTSPGSMPLILAAAISMVFVALVAGGSELAVWKPMRRRGSGLIQMFIVAIGLALLLRHIVQLVHGAQRRRYADYAVQQSIDFGLFTMTPRDLAMTLISIAVLIGVALLLQLTRIGKAMRAVSDNRDLAEASGINVDRVVLFVWMLGGALAGLGGVFFGLSQAVYPEMGFMLLLLMFAGVILGGLGSAYGAIVGSLVIGLVAQLSTIWFPVDLQFMWALLVMILVLLFRPQGILGKRERVG